MIVVKILSNENRPYYSNYALFHSMSEFSFIHFIVWFMCVCVCAIAEPGYYEDGNFGIRIENCVLVVKAETKVRLIRI